MNTIRDVRFLRAQKVTVEGITTPGADVVVENRSVAPFAPSTPDAFTRTTADAQGRFEVEVRAGREGDKVLVRSDAPGVVGLLNVRVSHVAAVDGRVPELRQQGVRLREVVPGEYALDNVCKDPRVGEPGAVVVLTHSRTGEATPITLTDDGAFPPDARLRGSAGDAWTVAVQDGVHTKTTGCGFVVTPLKPDARGCLAPAPPGTLNMTYARLQPLMGPLFLPGGPDPLSVRQGQLGDCYLLGVVVSVAQRNPQLIRDMIQDHGDGTFTVTFKKYDHARGGYVDEAVKVDNTMYTGIYGGLALGRCSTGETWLPILEKAYAAWRGSFDGARSGFPYEVFEAVLGEQGRHHLLEDAAADAVWAQLKRADARKDAMTTWTRVEDEQCPFTNTGLFPDHLYTVLETVEEGGERFVKLRNPWGRGRPAGGVPPDDGIFLLPLSTFMTRFVGVGCAPVPAARS